MKAVASAARHRSPLVTIAKRLRDEVSDLTFGPPVRHVYNPLDYGWRAHAEYLERFATGTRDVLIVGMNPSYFGMVQTGVPFGDVEIVREWLGIRTPVRRPRDEHPKRPIAGDACRRRDMSGVRLWGWAQQHFDTAERFFTRFFVHNYCPLCFLEQGGANRTVDKLPAREREPLFVACDRALRDSADAMGVRYAIGLGQFAARRVADVLDDAIRCGGAAHPSPANARAGSGWAAEMDRTLAALGAPVTAKRLRNRR